MIYDGLVYNVKWLNINFWGNLRTRNVARWSLVKEFLYQLSENILSKGDFVIKVENEIIVKT